VPDWVVSPRSGVAFLDLRESDVTLDAVETLLNTLVLYFERGQVKRVVVALKTPRVVSTQVLINSVKTETDARGVALEVQQE
jgi:hypothetical protein